ncbi:MAG: A/G-specific adenine glycosylase [Alphaproteobacteria bacterium]|nr:A/G-specific adenine glycosylase [Alphaproteobacteria bacterium]
MPPRRSSIGSPDLDPLLAWYDGARRVLPWRAAPGESPDPYRVWLSEIMLQQTTVAAVIPFFERFIRRWPRLDDLANANLDDVLAAWAGLGYYARARRLHACAGAIIGEHGGRFPRDVAGLRTLPGIGAYTAAAIAAIAFEVPVVPLDGNIERVLARIHAVTAPLPRAKPELRRRAAALVPSHRAGDVAQALMDLGAMVCTPRAPDCPCCPWQRNCRANALGIVGRLPTPAPKSIRPHRHGVAFWLERADGAVLLQRRPLEGLLGGMLEVPSTPWREDRWTGTEARRHGPAAVTWHPLPGTVEHMFTHFRLTLSVWSGVGGGAGGSWHTVEQLADAGLPSVMRKVVRHVAANKTPPRSERRSADRRTGHGRAP